jgi:hypothetical protein
VREQSGGESMSVVDPALEALRDSRGFVFGLILNTALILGVIVFEWSLVEIAVIYLIEVVVINLVFLFVALFTPQPVDDRDGDMWNTKPTPLQPISRLPPIYWRNIKFVGHRAIFSGIFIGVFIGGFLNIVFSSSYFDSGVPLSVGVAITGIILFQLRRVRRYFMIDQSYRHKSPLDAMQFAFAPVVELLLMLLYVFVPVTVVVGGTAIVMNVDVTSRLVLLLYLVPMGAIRAWIGSLDPQTDDLEISFG